MDFNNQLIMIIVVLIDHHYDHLDHLSSPPTRACSQLTRWCREPAMRWTVDHSYHHCLQFLLSLSILVMIIITRAVIAIEYFPTRWWVPSWEGRVVSLQGGESKNKMMVTMRLIVTRLLFLELWSCLITRSPFRLPNYALHAPTELKARQKKK